MIEQKPFVLWSIKHVTFFGTPGINYLQIIQCMCAFLLDTLFLMNLPMTTIVTIPDIGLLYSDLDLEIN